MHVSTSEKELQYREGYTHPSSAFTFRSPADLNDRTGKFPQSGLQNPAARERSAIVAEMLRKRRAEREARLESKQLTTLASSKDQPQDSPPETMRRVEHLTKPVAQDESMKFANTSLNRETYEPELVYKQEYVTEPDMPQEDSQSQEDMLGKCQYMPKESPLLYEVPTIPRNVRQNVFDRLTTDAKKKHDSRKPTGKPALLPPTKKITPSHERKKSKSPTGGPRIEDRLMEYQRDHSDWLRRQQFRKRSMEMNELQSSPKISPESEKLAKLSPRKYESNPPKPLQTRGNTRTNEVSAQQRQVKYMSNKTIENATTDRRGQQTNKAIVQ